MFTLSQCATLACLWEVTAPKPGNIHRGADFENLTFQDFVTSAVVIGPIIEAAESGNSVGQTILDAVQATRAAVQTNTNLGTILLLAPLAKVPLEQRLEVGVAQVLRELSPADARLIYEAIRTAQAGGLGHAEKHDLQGKPPENILDAMGLAAPHDLVAQQYVSNFDTVLNVVAPELRVGISHGWPMSDAIIYTQMKLLDRFPDSLIARKCGPDIAQQASDWAGSVLAAGVPGDEDYENGLASLDFWLRSDGHRRNPGTTADLIAAGLFVLLRNGELGGRTV